MTFIVILLTSTLKSKRAFVNKGLHFCESEWVAYYRQCVLASFISWPGCQSGSLLVSLLLTQSNLFLCLHCESSSHFSDRQHNTCCPWLEHNFIVLLLPPLSNTYQMHFKRRINVGIVDHRTQRWLGFDDGLGSGSCVLLWPFPHAACLWSELQYTWRSQLALHVIHHVCKTPLRWCSVWKGRCWDVCRHVWLNGLKMVWMTIDFVFGPFISLSPCRLSLHFPASLGS